MPICGYCNRDAALVTGAVIYEHRPDLAKKRFWLCRGCGTYVGCHPGTSLPLGTLANAELREARTKAHAAFDPLWKDKLVSRKQAYKLLAHELGVDYDQTHISYFNLDLCHRTILASQELKKHLKGN